MISILLAIGCNSFYRYEKFGSLSRVGSNARVFCGGSDFVVIVGEVFTQGD